MENQKITGKTELLCLIGSPVEHSKSPLLQNALSQKYNKDLAYLAYDVTLDTLDDAMKGLKALGFKGCNITMPLKSAVIDYVDELSTASRLSGAVNTIKVVDGKLEGYTTDGIGCLKAFKRVGFDAKGKKLTIVGAGGAATAVIVQAALDGVKEISVFNIRDKFWTSLTEKLEMIEKESGCNINLYDLEDKDKLREEMNNCDFFINGTPIGMGKTVGQSVIPDSSYFASKPYVLDMIYNPEVTKTAQLAMEAGCEVISGLNMLTFQGVASFEIWNELDVDLDFAIEVMK